MCQLLPKKLTLRDYFDELFSSILSYDSKLLKTLSALLLRPGRITKDYIEGKRVSYTNPFRFLLSLAIVYFLMINFTGDYSRFDRFSVTKENDLPDGIKWLEGFDISVNVEGEKVILNEKYDSIKRKNEVQGLFGKHTKA